MKKIGTVINNNQPGWTNIIETEPNVTLDVGTKLYIPNPQTTDLKADTRLDNLLSACKILLERWDKKEDEHHDKASQHPMVRYHSGMGSAYGICQEELRQIIKSIRQSS